MIKKKIFPYLIIIILMVMCTLENAFDISSTYDMAISNNLLINVLVSILFGMALDMVLFGISKIKISGADVKVLFQVISYFLVSVWFILWSLHMDMSFIVENSIEPTMAFVQGFYKHILFSQFYTLIAVAFMKSISIPIHIKDFKNEI